MIKIGIVIQRYGQEVVGGAETLARNVAERLNASGCDVTVFTTTAKDYITWKNEFQPGNSILKGVNIRRFPVERERDINAFDRFSTEVFANVMAEHPAFNPEEEKEWVERQGPYCPSLIEALRRSQDEINVFIFFTYLYYPTIEGLKVVDKPAILFPTAHDEPPLYLNLMKEVFCRPDALFFLTAWEMKFIRDTFQPVNASLLVRSGVDIRSDIDPQLFRKRFGQCLPYLLYAGRIEKGKGLETVFDAYHELRKRRLIDLVLMGKKWMDIPSIDGIKYVGFVSEEEKLSAFKGAVASIQPSPLESLSITTLESFSQQTPVLVNKKCQALQEHIEISRGGLAYENTDELMDHCHTLYDNRKLRYQMGINGYHYVQTYYSWDMMIQKVKMYLTDTLTTKEKIYDI